MRFFTGLLLGIGCLMALGVVSVCSAQGQTQGQTPESAEALLDAAASQSANIGSLSADFVQEKSMAVLARPMTSQGYFCLRRASKAAGDQARGEQRAGAMDASHAAAAAAALAAANAAQSTANAAQGAALQEYHQTKSRSVHSPHTLNRVDTALHQIASWKVRAMTSFCCLFDNLWKFTA